MKRIIVFLVILLSGSLLRAQIVLEHEYQNFGRDFSIVTVDSGIEKYVDYNREDSIYIYNLDHTIDKIFHVPVNPTIYGYDIGYISKKLFNDDDAYEFLIQDYSGLRLRIFNEKEDLLFSCDNCGLNDFSIREATQSNAAIYNTSQGVKMIIKYYDSAKNIVAVFGLPGKLYGGATKSGVNAPAVITTNALPTSAYPNPSNGQMRISYKLPLGESIGDLVILSAAGVEVKRYKVGYGFNDILVEKSDLPSGSYFYKLVTPKGESEVKKLVILK